jgi:hypothetical protein
MPRVSQSAHARRRQANTILVVFDFLRQSNYHFAVSPISREELKLNVRLTRDLLHWFFIFVNLRAL